MPLKLTVPGFRNSERSVWYRNTHRTGGFYLDKVRQPSVTLSFKETFLIKTPTGIKNAGEQTITVIFTVTTPGDYLNPQLEHDVAVTISKQQIT